MLQFIDSRYVASKVILRPPFVSHSTLLEIIVYMIFVILNKVYQSLSKLRTFLLNLITKQKNPTLAINLKYSLRIPLHRKA